MAGTSLVKVGNTALIGNLKWYEFSQNNSGGSFVTDERVGHYVIVQARNAKEAAQIAQNNGVYFNGVEDGYDCGCCGDRWYEPWSDNGSDEFPKAYVWKDGGMMVDYAILDTKPTLNDNDWLRGGKYAVIYFFDGTRKYGIPAIPE